MHVIKITQLEKYYTSIYKRKNEKKNLYGDNFLVVTFLPLVMKYIRENSYVNINPVYNKQPEIFVFEKLSNCIKLGHSNLHYKLFTRKKNPEFLNPEFQQFANYWISIKLSSSIYEGIYLWNGQFLRKVSGNIFYS